MPLYHRHLCPGRHGRAGRERPIHSLWEGLCKGLINMDPLDMVRLVHLPGTGPEVMQTQGGVTGVKVKV
jgi:hypothetical protein